MDDVKRMWLRESLKQTGSPAALVAAVGVKQKDAVKRCRCSKNLVSKVLAKRIHSGEKAKCVMAWASEVTGLPVHELFPNRRKGGSG